MQIVSSNKELQPARVPIVGTVGCNIGSLVSYALNSSPVFKDKRAAHLTTAADGQRCLLRHCF